MDSFYVQAKDIHMIWEREFVKLVKNEFQKKKTKNPRFSVRQYAKKLDLSIGALSEILNGKRQLTRARALKVIANLDTDVSEVERMHMLMGEKLGAAGTSTSPSDPLPDLQEIIPDWRNFVILSALFHPESEKLIPRIASFTQMPAEEVTSRLVSLRGKITNETDYINFSMDPFKESRRVFTGDSLQKYQEGHLKLLGQAMDSTAASDRLFCNISLATSQEVYEQVTSEVREIFLRLLGTDQKGPADKFFQVSLQMFPLEAPKA